MTNLTKLKRDRMINFLEELKSTHTDDESIRAFNEIENALTEKKFGLVFEEHSEEVDKRLLEEIPVFCADESRKICKDKDLPYNFIIEGDNLIVINSLKRLWKVPWELHSIIEDIRNLISVIPSVVFYHCFTESNVASDFLTRRQVDLQSLNAAIPFQSSSFPYSHLSVTQSRFLLSQHPSLFDFLKIIRRDNLGYPYN